MRPKHLPATPRGDFRASPRYGEFPWKTAGCAAQPIPTGSTATIHARHSSLVPRTRSSHDKCRESGCELRVRSGTRIIELVVSFDSEVRIGLAARLSELRNRDT